MNTDTRIFISGATGLIGSNLVRLLLKRGYNNIIALKRPQSPLELLDGSESEIEWIEGDLFDLEVLARGMENTDLVIHAAALISFIKRDFKELMRTNVQGTANMVNVALESGTKHFHFISSVAALGRNMDQRLVTEKSHFLNTKLDTGYAFSKHNAEMEVWRAAAEGLDVSIINPSLVLGAGFWNKGSTSYFDRIAKGLNFYPLGGTGFVDVRDVAKMIYILIKSDITGERFICNGWNARHKEVIDQISATMNRKPPSYPLSKLLAGLAWKADRIRSIVLSAKPILSRESLRISSESFEFDNSKSLSILGMDYTPRDKTIQELALIYEQSKKENKDYGIMSI